MVLTLTVKEIVMKKLLVGGVLAATLAAPAYAHTHLKSAVPADGSTLESAPTQFVLTFTEPARITALSIQKEGAVEQKISALPTTATAEAKVVAPKLENGRYTLNYRVVGADGHVMSGKVSFTVGGKPAAGTPPHADHAHKH
jgi:methionine-rich copper-binding protein CopC